MNEQVKGSTDIAETFDKLLEAQHPGTGVVYDEKMEEYFCRWDPDHTESPARWRSVIDRCTQLGLLHRCVRLPSRPATQSELRTCHSARLLQHLEKSSRMDVEDLKVMSSSLDCVYMHEASYAAALLSAGAAIDLTLEVMSGRIQNGMGILRPPGHHAMYDVSSGYCYLNNVALAATAALNKGARKVAIVDWDVHHGQGTQRVFYRDNRVLYISIHRYEYGYWWPNLKESDFCAIGEGEGRGFNINIPLNVTGNTDSDYLALWHSVVLPVLKQFSPDVLLVSAGYDTAVGCPEGEQSVTPACFAHLTRSLMEVGNGRVAAFLEGGYFLPSLAEGAALTLRTLLGCPVPELLQGTQPPNTSIQETISAVSSTLSPHWTCFDDFRHVPPPAPVWRGPEVVDNGGPYDIMCPTPPRGEDLENHFRTLVQNLIRDTSLSTFDTVVYRAGAGGRIFKAGLEKFKNNKVQILIGSHEDESSVSWQNYLASLRSTVKLVLGAPPGDGQGWIQLHSIKSDDVHTLELGGQVPLVLNCTSLLQDQGLIFKVLVPLLYRVCPHSISWSLLQDFNEEENKVLGFLSGQLQCLGSGRTAVFASPGHSVSWLPSANL